MAINRYNPNSKLTRLLMELEEAENELENAPEHRKALVETRIKNIKAAIKDEEEKYRE